MPPSRRRVETLLPAAALLSVYFPKYFFVFSPNSPRRAADEAVGALELLGLGWFGVMKVRPDLSVEILRDAQGPPLPDRTSEYESLRAALTFPSARSRRS